jgi:PAS domain S-box-containing protein
MGEYKRFALLVFVIIGPLLIVGAPGGYAAQAETREVVAAVARDFYPEYVVDADGRPGGFSIDLMNAVAKRAGLSVTYRLFEAWSDLIAALERGDADVVPVVSITSAREGRMLFTRPLVTSPASLFVRQDTDDVRGWSDLAGRRVGVIAGGVSEELLSEREKSARLVPYARLQDALFGLLSGEVDALVSFESSVWKVSERARLADRIKVVGDPLTQVKRAIAVRQDLPGLRDRLDAAVADFLDSSEYRKLYSEWYAAPPSLWNPGRIGWVAGASVALLLLGMLFWQSLSLRAESRRLAERKRAAVEFPARVISQACGLIALALGFAVLLGWVFEVTALKSVLPGLFAMQPWAAITIALAGGALLVATVPGRMAAATSTALGGTVLIIGLQMLLQHATGVDLGTDRWFFPEAVGNQPGHPHPGRVAEVTSIAFALLGTVLLLARVERAWARVVFSTIGTVGLLLMAAPLVGYLIGAGVLQSATFFTPIALHAALGLVVLFLGALALRPDTGWMAVLSGDMPGATSARLLLPVTVTGPVLLAWLFTSGRQAGLYGPDFQVGLITLATIALLGNALLWNAARLDRLHRARLAAAEALRQSEERYRSLVEAQPDPICQFLPDTTLTFVNRAYAKYYGREPQELIGKRWLDFAASDERPRFLDELATFTPEHPERHEETRSTRADRKLRWYLCHVYGFFDDAGNILSFQTFGTDITARKGAEEHLAEQLGLLTAITDSAADAIFVSDGEDCVTLMNPAAERIFGWSRQELTGRKLHDAIHDRHPDGRPYPASECPLSRVYTTGETLLRHEDVFFHKDGSQVPVACSNAPLMIEDRIAGSVLVAHDITERKRTDAALRESEARYRTAGDAIRYGVWVCNPEGGVEFVSQTFLDLIGKTLDEVKPRGWLDRLPPEDLKPTLEAWHKCVRTGSEWTWEHRVKGKDGAWRTILSLGRPVRDDRDRITSWVGFNLDISARKEAEDALRESEVRFRGTFENAAVGIANVGTDGAWLRVNQRLCEILGYSHAELLQKHFQEMTHPEDLPFNLDRFTALMRGEIDTYHLEKRYLHKDGHAVWVDLTAAVQRDDAGNPAYCIAIIEDIGARKRAEEALRESEARLRRTVENAPFPIMVHAEDGEVVHLSQAWLDLTGYTREEIGTIAAWTERAYGERKEVVRADIDQLYALEQAVDEGEDLIRTADGRTRVWTFRSSPLGSDDRGRRLVVSMAADVTERKEAEQALRESEIRMRALLDASQDEILLLSAEGRVLAINKAAQRRLAKRAGGSIPVGAHLDRLLPQDQVDSRMAIVRQVASTATLDHRDVLIRSRWFEFWFYPVLEPDKPVSEVAVYAREITAQKKSQADLSKLFQAIQQSPTSVVITDRDGNIEYVNPKFTDVTGYTLAEAIGRNPRILKSGHTPPEQYAELWNTITAGGVWRGEFLNKKKNGELFWELASIAPVREGEKITNFVAVKENITERREMEEQLRQSQKTQAVGQLTGGIAHDFNNLLAIVMGNLQLLQERVSGDAKAREYLDDALWSAKRGGELTHRLLAFARKQPLKPAVIDLNDVVRGMTELLRRTLGASIRIEESLAPNLWKAFADRGELENALVNLAVNSRDAMRSTGTLTLETRNAVLDEDYAEQYEEVTPGEYVLFAVADTGTGMSAEIMQRAFEPFFTTKEVGQGSGLGLSMVYGFVKQTGGHVSIYSRVGQGTCVKLYLPRAPSSPVGREKDSPDVFPEDLGNRVVLVVEDEARLRKVAVKMLDRLGLQSLQAETAKDALELLADTHVDVLFTDIELPGGMNGTELADVAHHLYPELKVLFTTGYARETTLHEGGLHERAPWLLKPYSHQELSRELKALLAPTVH